MLDLELQSQLHHPFTPGINTSTFTGQPHNVSAAGGGGAGLSEDDVSEGYIISNPKVLDTSVTLPGGSNGAVYGPEITIAESTVITVDNDASLLLPDFNSHSYSHSSNKGI